MRFPPREKYRYSRSQVDSEICHLRQNSVTFSDRYGMLKLRGIVSPIHLADPMAISE